MAPVKNQLGKVFLTCWFFNSCIHFWLCWVSALREGSLWLQRAGAALQLRGAGLSLWRPPLLWSASPGAPGSVAVLDGLPAPSTWGPPRPGPARACGISRQALEPGPPGKPHRALSLPLSGSRFSRRHHTDSRPGKRPLLCVLPLSRRLYPIQGPSRGHMACRRTSLFLSRRQLRLWSA